MPEFIPVEYDPFATEKTKPVLTTEPQREILANIFLGGHAANCSYIESVSLNIRGPLDPALIRIALSRVIERHRALRSVFSTDGLTFTFADPLADLLEETDLSLLGEEERAAKLREILDREAEEAFAIHTGPLYRFRLVKHQHQLHQLILSFHHLVCDGWSIGIIMKDLGTLYSALKTGIQADLPEPADFTVYAANTAIYEEGSSYANDLEYWVSKFQRSLPSFEFPPDKPRPAVRTFNAYRTDVAVPEPLVEKIRKTAAQKGVSYVTFLTSAYEVFLSRITQNQDVTLALPAAGQPATEHYDLVGHCVNVLPLRSEVDHEMTVFDYLKKRKTSLLDDYEHQRITFGSLVRKLNIPRDPSRIPLVPIAFNLDIGITDGVYFDGCTFEFTTNPRHYENFEIAINASGEGNRLTLECLFNTDLFAKELMRSRMENFIVMLDGIITNPDQPIATLPLLTPVEKELFFEKWNPIDRDFHVDKTLHEWFEEIANTFPDRIALASGELSMTYRELNDRANFVSDHIVQRNIPMQSFIGILTHRNFDVITAILGVLKSGCAYVPIDPAYPADRIFYILKDAGCPLLIVSESLQTLAGDYSGDMMIIDTLLKESSSISITANPRKGTTPHDLAYMIYTSGSTGQPKGALLEHRNVTRLFAASQPLFHFNESDVWTMFHSAAFDVSVWEMWGALLHGGRLVIVPRDTSRDPQSFYRLMRNEKVTILIQTPASLLPLVAYDDTISDHSQRITSLRYVMFGGEAFEPQRLKPWFIHHGDTHPQVIHQYGITETTVIVTNRRLTMADTEGHNCAIGVPIPDLQVYLLDKHQQPVPLGLPGELCVGGAGVGRGYLSREELTASRFIFNEFNPFSGTRMYRSGDLARYRPNGDLEYLGRIDTQVKIHGFRIELGEIEFVIGKHPDVKQQAVITGDDASGSKRLIAYVVMHDGKTLQVNEFREFLRNDLPDYMIPAAIVTLDRLPVTSNGKLDIKALPSPELSMPDRGPVEEPANVIEEALNNIWCDVLCLPVVGRSDNFFELGGHSILGVQLLNHLEKELGVKLELPVLFGSPTIRELAAIIANRGVNKPIPSIVPLQPKGNKTPLFCIHMHNGNIHRWRVLIKHLGNDQPIYAIQPVGIDVNNEPHHNIEEMAAHYISLMRSVQPAGPYRLAGLCFGGMVVFEMALQLQRMNEKVDFLGMVNNYAPVENPNLTRLTKGIDKFLKMNASEKVKYLMEKNKHVAGSLLKKIGIHTDQDHGTVNEMMIDDPSTSSFEAGHDLRTIHSKALMHYHPTEVFQGNLMVVRSGEPIEKDYNEKMGWDRLVAGQIEIRSVAGSDNDTIITDEPYNVELSAVFREFLAK